MPPFCVGFSKQRKKPGWRRWSNCVQNAFFQLFPSSPDKKNSRGIKFYNFGFMPPFWVGFSKQRKKPGLRRSSNCVQNTFLNFPYRVETKKKTLGIEIYNFGFMPPFWVGLSKQRKKPGLRRSSNCVQNTFLNFPYRVETKKKPLGSKFTISVSCHHFGWAFPISGKSRVDEGRPIAFKTRFLNFPYRVETKKNPWDRFYNFGPILDWGLYNFGLVNSLGIEFYNFGFMPPFWVGFSKQRKKPGWRRSSNCVQNAFFQLFPSWPDKRNSREIKFYNFGFMPPFCVGFSKQRKKPGWRRWSNIVQNAFSQLFPSWPDKKNSREIKFYNFGFMPPFCVGFSKQRKKPGWRRWSNCVQNAFFQLFPSSPDKKNSRGIKFYNFSFMPPFWVRFSKQRKMPGWRRSSNCVPNAFFQLSPSGRNEKTSLGSNFTISVSCHHFGWAFPSSGKSRIDEGRPIAFKTRFFYFPHRGETRKHPWDRILQFRFHATILGGLFQAAEKTGFTKVVQLRSKRVFSTFPIGAKRKNTLGIEFYNFGFMAQFRVGFSKMRKKPGWRKSSNCVRNAFFLLSPSGRNEKTPLGSNFTVSVSCHHFGWAFPSSRKSRVDEGRPIALKTSFFNFPHRGETKKHPWDRILQFLFYATIFGGLIQAAEKAGFTKVVQLRSKRVFSSFPFRAKPKKHHWDRILQFRFHATILGGLFQAAEKAGMTNVVQLRSKRVFSTFPIGSKRKNSLGIEFYNFGFMPPFWVGLARQKKKPWAQILQFQFHSKILGGLFKAAEKAVLTKVVQLLSKRVFSTFPIGAKRKNSLGIEFYNFGFMPPFWVGFSKQRKKPGLQSSSNCVQNTFFKLSLSGRNEKKPLGSILQFRFHATILGGLFQAAEKAGFTKFVQLRSKHVF